jgi:hypothetical protein
MRRPIVGQLDGHIHLTRRLGDSMHAYAVMRALATQGRADHFVAFAPFARIFEAGPLPVVPSMRGSEWRARKPHAFRGPRHGEHVRHTMARAAGIEGADLRVRLPFPPQPPTDRPYVVVCPHASASYKEWSPHRWAPLIAQLLEYRLQVYVCGAPNRPPIPAPDDAVFLDLDPVGLAGIVAGACAVIGPDSGPLHLADALGVPTVGLYGATHAGTYGPYGGAACLVFAHADADRCANTARHVPGGMAGLALDYERIAHAVAGGECSRPTDDDSRPIA